MAWSRKKVDSATINDGNEYVKGSRVSRQNLNAMVNSGLYAQDFAEKLVTNIDTSEIGGTGTPSVTLIAGDGATAEKPYKKFKFSNLKGEKGDKGEKGEKGDKGESGEIYQTTGTSTTGAMSQDATTKELAAMAAKLPKIIWEGEVRTGAEPVSCILNEYILPSDTIEIEFGFNVSDSDQKQHKFFYKTSGLKPYISGGLMKQYMIKTVIAYDNTSHPDTTIYEGFIPFIVKPTYETRMKAIEFYSGFVIKTYYSDPPTLAKGSGLSATIYKIKKIPD